MFHLNKTIRMMFESTWRNWRLL